MYLNSGRQEKLQEDGWLISAILVKSNHLAAPEAEQVVTTPFPDLWLPGRHFQGR